MYVDMANKWVIVENCFLDKIWTRKYVFYNAKSSKLSLPMVIVFECFFLPANNRKIVCEGGIDIAIDTATGNSQIIYWILSERQSHITHSIEMWHVQCVSWQINMNREWDWDHENESVTTHMNHSEKIDI